jgi:uncharacterized membrane protein
MSFGLILVRWMHLSASLLLAGMFLFETVIVAPVARKPTADVEHLLSRINGLTGRVALWALLAIRLLQRKPEYVAIPSAP